MGSFYGTTFQELKETFKRLIVKNKNNVTPITAKGVEDSITFESMDPLIVLEGDDNKQTISISHGTPTDESTEVTVFSLTHDGAQPSIDELQPGQLFYITSSGYDNKGHQNTTITRGYKLPPQTDTEAELGDITERVTNLEAEDSKIWKALEENYTTKDSQIENERRLGDLETFKDTTVPNTYSTKEETGSVTDMKSSTAYDKYTSIAALIGNIEELNAELGFNPDKRALTLSEALMEILPKIQAELETLPYTFQGIKGQISELEDRIQQLEDK